MNELRMDNINKELRNIHKMAATEFLYRKEILDYVFNLRDKEEYQNLSDNEFFDIVREVFKINPSVFINFVYDELMNKMRIRYGDEKRKEMEEYLLEKDFIREIFKINPAVFNNVVYDKLMNKMHIRYGEEGRSFIEHYILEKDFIREIFEQNSKDFMKFTYQGLRKKLGKFYGEEGRTFIEHYIFKNFCLYNDEQILLEFKGDIKQVEDLKNNIYVEVGDGTIFITNYRIIAQGNFRVKGHSSNADLFGGTIAWLLSGGSKRARSKESFLDISANQEIPCYGYQFKRKNLFGLKKKSSKVKYLVYSENVPNMSGASIFKIGKTLMKEIRIITIKPPIEQIDELYELLLKKDVDEIVDQFQEIIDMGLNVKMKRKRFLKGLQNLWKINEYQYLSDSEKLNVVVGVYELDPEFFMGSIYPEMKSWNFPAFLSVKDELFELLNKEGANII